MTVSELTQILGQSQPRVSRHLRLLCEAGLLDRRREGSWAYFRQARHGPGAELARTLVDSLQVDDPVVSLDLERLETVMHARARRAADYFRRNAAKWDEIRSLYVDDAEVEQRLLELVPEDGVHDLLDIGTGTGRILQIFGARVGRGIGIDASREMLSVARANLAKQDLSHCQVRHGDMYNLSGPDGSVDVVTIHHVLHFLDDPAAAIAEAAQALRPRGRLLIVDFAPHGLEVLRSDYAHRRLGFDDAEVTAWCLAAGLEDVRVKHLTVTGASDAEKLTVSLWTSRQRADAPAHYQLDVA